MSDANADFRAEYTMIQAQYEAFDGRALTIKSWASPLLAGGLGLGIKEWSIGIELATALAAGCLWVLEAIWKNFQYCYVSRIKLLEKYFRGENIDAEMVPFQIFTTWGAEWRREFKHSKALRQRLSSNFVYLPYLPIITGCVLSIFWIALRSK